MPHYQVMGFVSLNPSYERLPANTGGARGRNALSGGDLRPQGPVGGSAVTGSM